MTDMPKCRNAHYDHENPYFYKKKYDGYCLDCANAGVPELADRVRELEDADKEVDQLRADNLAVRAERDALRERVRVLELFMGRAAT